MFLFDRECTHISEYYFEDGLRKVKPYYHVLELSVPLLKEPITLRDYLLENVVFDVDIQRARFDLELEKFYVNLKPANCQDLLKSGDVISLVQHKHEHAVLGSYRIQKFVNFLGKFF